MLHYGMPTLIEAPSPEETVRLCKELGLSFAELNMNLPEYQPDRMPVHRLKALAEANGLFFTLHLDENFNPFDFNPHVRAGWLRTMEESLSIARELGSPLINLHLNRGVYFTLPGERVYLFDKYRDHYFSALEALRTLCSSADAPLICIENTDGFPPLQQEAIDFLLESPRFALTYDVGHDYGVGHADQEFILKRQARLCHMHLHDASPNGCHLPLGDGLLDKSFLLGLARKTGSTIVLETKTLSGLRDSVQWLRSNGFLP